MNPEQNGCPLVADNTSTLIFFNDNVWSMNKISLKFVPKGPIDNKSALVHVMAWHWTGDRCPKYYEQNTSNEVINGRIMKCELFVT